MSTAVAKLPAIGLGTGPLKGDVGIALMAEAIRMGYRLLDTAQHYGNEREVGEAVRASGVPRDEIIVLTKVWPDKIGAKDFPRAAEESLQRLGLDRIDLLVPHWANPSIPMAESIGALNAIHKAGLARQIGLSNFTPRQLAEARALSEAPLIANEVEYQPYLNQDVLLTACRESGVTVITHCPLHRVGPLFLEPVVAAAAARLGKTPAQIVLRWHVQQGCVPIPSSRALERLRENIDVFDFALTAEEMTGISALSANPHRICQPPIPYDWN
jgi:diketogulonate reductase-like aldo/keto reductase